MGLACVVRKEAKKHGHQLLAGGFVDHDLDITSAWADEGGVKILDVIGSHDQYSAFLRNNPVDCVEQSGKGKTGLSVAMYENSISKLPYA